MCSGEAQGQVSTLDKSMTTQSAVAGLLPKSSLLFAGSWITLGIFAVGLFVVTLLIKPALIIEERYQEHLGREE